MDFSVSTQNTPEAKIPNFVGIKLEEEVSSHIRLFELFRGTKSHHLANIHFSCVLSILMGNSM